MMRVLIVGAGGQGLVVADMLLRAREQGSDAIPMGLLDDDAALEGVRLLGLSVLGPCACVSDIAHEAIVVAIGDNHRREDVSLSFEQRGERLFVACHPGASLAGGVELGVGCMVSAGAVVMPGVKVARGVLLNTRCSVDHHSVVGAFAHIGPGATVGADVTIGDRTLVGLGASVMSGRRVGADTVVGAGALVTRDLPDGVVAVGVPARVTRARR